MTNFVDISPLHDEILNLIYDMPIRENRVVFYLQTNQRRQTTFEST